MTSNHLAIQVDSLGKRYRIGAQEEQHDTFVSTILHQIRKPLANLRRLRQLSQFDQQRDQESVFWALRGVSFTVNAGEVVGIIGRNGAGKSTLLKMLSRITAPTEGVIQLRGRVSSLLEVGTGFHPELTGRENIYLNGTILGMRKTEIDRKFDEIVDFSGVEKFIDTPIKRYSSGMSVRLAFSVAAHLEPEILLIDEVLAVGDAEFQRKCLGKMDQVASTGRTVLFVSHQMAAVEALCKRVILLDHGQVLADGKTSAIIEQYLSSSFEEGVVRDNQLPAYSESHQIGILSVQAAVKKTRDGFKLEVEFDVEVSERIRNVGVGFMLKTTGGIRVSSLDPYITNYGFEGIEGKTVRCTLWCDNIDRFISGGNYTISLWLSLPRIKRLVTVEDVVTINIPHTDIFGTGFEFKAEKNGLVPLRADFGHTMLPVS